jgi:CheY-like chemotaxis protein
MGKRILLADDSITIQKVIELTFSDEDFEVVTVGNGRLAIERVQEVRPDVVLCDIIMPERDGYEVCEFIKKTPALAQIPVLLLTGAFEPFDQERAARVGCDGFLAKPFEPETLIAKVKDLLAKAASRQTPPAEILVVRPAAPPPLPPPVPVVPPNPPAFAAAPAPTAAFAAPMDLDPATTASFAATTPSQPAPVFTVPPPPVPPPPVDETEMTFIPDEPFDDLETPPFGAAPVTQPSAKNEPAAAAYAVVDTSPAEELVAMTADEAEALRTPAGAEDSAATVMFRADSLPWGEAGPAPFAPPESGTADAPTASELPVFEEVLEEEEIEASAATVIQPDAPPFPLEPAPPPPAFEAPPLPVAPPTPPVMEVQGQPLRAPEPPPPAPFQAPPAVEPPLADSSSFADVAAAIAPPEPPTPSSVAAQVEVPVDMVSQIAQRVVAQVSERVVERIAWDVIPALAEALIKREIERLKAELQHLQ